MIFDATIKNSGNVFRIMKLELLNCGRGFLTGGNVFPISRNKFYDWKNEILMICFGGKKSGIGIIVEFQGIPTGFPNQALQLTRK